MTLPDLVARARDLGKPALAALLENVFRMDRDEAKITFCLDPSRENLIPLLKSDAHRLSLDQIVETMVGEKVDLDFDLVSDPRLEQKRAELRQAEILVKSDPTVKYTLDLFQGKIIQCVPISENEEETNHGSSGSDEPGSEHAGKPEK